MSSPADIEDPVRRPCTAVSDKSKDHVMTSTVRWAGGGWMLLLAAYASVSSSESWGWCSSRSPLSARPSHGVRS